MKSYVAVSLSLGALTSAAVALAAVAAAAPPGPSQLEETVRTLETSGYHVIVNRTGAGPLSECRVSAVRRGQTYSTRDSRGGGSINTTITSQTVYVDVAC
ncbi:hypothetical protein [Mycobacterium sp.]|jgi:hypothetical protein|uniref:hypothetical protein n=1 Tax=Mycobacterium sp. TaxID=1785 RepID=UPI00333F4858|nr:hypothetical protein [Mycobacterium sp.]